MIGLTGLASGLDSEAIIQALMAIERQPRVRLGLRESQVEARQGLLRDISSRLKSLKTAAADLRSVALWADTQTVESSDSTKVAARLVSSAGPGGYQVEVSQLARAEQRTYDYTASTSATQIDIDGVVFDIAANATLGEVVDTINGRSDSPVYAVNVDGRLVLSSRQTGAANGFTATGTTIVQDTALAKAGLDAAYSVDGTAKTSASNVVANAIPGLELTLKGLTSSAITVTVGEPAPDREAIKEKVKAFVEKYNQAIDFIRAKLSEDRVPNATRSADAAKGVLRGDTMLAGLLSRLRQSLTAAYAGNPDTMDQLMEIGISTGGTTGSGTISDAAVAGRLVLDEAKLDAALESSALDVKRLLGGESGVDGFAQAFEGIVDPATQAGGTLDARVGAADSELDRIRDRMEALDFRLAAREERLRAQFAALETLLAQSQAQGQWLAGQLATLSSTRSK